MTNRLEFSKFRKFQLMLSDTKDCTIIFIFNPKSTTEIDCLLCSGKNLSHVKIRLTML